jgi:hypothetical protein
MNSSVKLLFLGKNIKDRLQLVGASQDPQRTEKISAKEAFVSRLDVI